jgi:hypothetical protein
MSKVKELKKEIVPEINMNGATEEPKPSPESVLESLKAQQKDFSEKSEYFKTMSLKALGAIEILTQLHGDDGKS